MARIGRLLRSAQSPPWRLFVVAVAMSLASVGCGGGEAESPDESLSLIHI